MSEFLIAAAAVLAAYLLGSVSFAVVCSRLFGLADPRSYGSKNPGATNVLRSGNKAAAVCTLAGDMAKGWLAVFLAQTFGPGFGLGPEGLVGGFPQICGLRPGYGRFHQNGDIAHGRRNVGRTAGSLQRAIQGPLGSLAVGLVRVGQSACRLPRPAGAVDEEIPPMADKGLDLGQPRLDRQHVVPRLYARAVNIEFLRQGRRHGQSFAQGFRPGGIPSKLKYTITLTLKKS